MDIQIIETERLLLRQLTPGVYQWLFDSYNDEELKTFFGFGSDDALIREKEKFSLASGSYSKPFVLFQMIEKASSHVIGSCGFHNWHTEHFRAEAGYALTQEGQKRKGFMREAMTAVVRYGFEEIKLNRIEAFISPSNSASLNLIRSLGFKEEGLLREHYCKNNEIHDSVVFSLLRKEYESGVIDSGSAI